MREINLQEDIEEAKEMYMELKDVEHILTVTTKQKLKPCEGLCINLPTGKPALQFITYKDIEVSTITKDNRVKLEVTFDDPFINREAHAQGKHNS